ncbi:Mu transposase domain-containing protein, partial [Allobaculum fili]
KYSLISVDNNQYSVPDNLIGKKVRVKTYTETIKVYYEHEQVAEHQRINDGKQKTCFDIRHYLSTLRKKPGALRNSTALKADPELKSIYDNYFSEKPKEFIEILTRHKDRPMEEIKDLLRIEACQAPQRQSVYEPLAAQ